MLKRLAQDALTALVGDDNKELAELRAVEVAELEERIAQLERQLERGRALEVAGLEDRIVQLERIKGEYFEVIERIAVERDQWKRMFFEQSRGHLNAQALLERTITHTRNQLRACVAFLKAKVGAEAVEEMAKVARAVDAPPIGTAIEYGKKMLALAEEQVPKDTDAAAEQKRLTSEE